jgi:hypothetical protein
MQRVGAAPTCAQPDEWPGVAEDPLRLRSLERRLRLALLDLRIDRCVPASWIQNRECDLAFGSLTATQADHLVCALEGLARGVSGEAAPAGPGHPPLF